MEEFDSHTEHAAEQIHEKATEAREPWISGAALTAAILAALAAIASLLSGHHEHEAMLEQVRASDQWAYYQAEGIKAAVTEGRLAGADDDAGKLKQKLARYEEKRAELRKDANELERSSQAHDAQHRYLAGAVTFFQVAIAVVAVSVLTRRRSFWYFGILLGIAAIACLGIGLVSRG